MYLDILISYVDQCKKGGNKKAGKLIQMSLQNASGDANLVNKRNSSEATCLAHFNYRTAGVWSFILCNLLVVLQCPSSFYCCIEINKYCVFIIHFSFYIISIQIENKINNIKFNPFVLPIQITGASCFSAGIIFNVLYCYMDLTMDVQNEV